MISTCAVLHLLGIDAMRMTPPSHTLSSSEGNALCLLLAHLVSEASSLRTPFIPAQPELLQLSGEELVDVLAALACCREPPASPWLAQAATTLLPLAAALPADSAARCLWALAKLKHHPGPALLDACCAALAAGVPLEGGAPPSSAWEGPEEEEPPQLQLAKNLGLPITVDAIWGLSRLGAPVPAGWLDEMSTRLAGK